MNLFFGKESHYCVFLRCLKIKKIVQNISQKHCYCCTAIYFYNIMKFSKKYLLFYSNNWPNLKNTQIKTNLYCHVK